MFTMKKLIRAELGEIKSVSLVCSKCGEKLTTNWLQQPHAIITECPSCGEHFHDSVKAEALRFTQFIRNYNELVRQHLNGAFVEFDIEE
jgi:uncharacterized Zn finger protein